MPFNTIQHTTPVTTIGEFTRPEAFAAARALEHAGITTDVRGNNDTYRVAVNQEHAERARTIV